MQVSQSSRLVHEAVKISVTDLLNSIVLIIYTKADRTHSVVLLKQIVTAGAIRSAQVRVLSVCIILCKVEVGSAHFECPRGNACTSGELGCQM